MAPRVKKQKDEDGEGGPAHGSNVPDGGKLLGFIEQVENLEQDKASARGEYMQTCKVISEDIKQVFSDAKAAGFRKKAMKAQLEKRALTRKLDDVGSDLEGDDSDAYAAMDLALEKLKEAA
jgi:uncharacterized protein (UPF0335 family)